MAIIKANATYTRTFLTVYKTDHLTGATGLTVIVRLSKAGAAFGAAAGSVSAIANGWYSIALTTADTNTLGDLSFNCSGTNIDPTDFVDQIVNFDFNTPVVTAGTTVDKSNYTLASGTYAVNLTGSVNNVLSPVNLSSGVNVTQWVSGTVPAVNVTGVPLIDLKYTLGTISPATAGSVRTDQVTAGVTVTTNNDKTGYLIVGGTAGRITGNIDGSVGSVTGAVGSVTGNVGGNVTGSVGSVVGAVGSVTGAVGSVTGNVGGNVTGSVGSVVGSVGSVTGNVSGSVNSVVNSVVTGTNSDKTGYSLLAGQLFIKKNTALANFMFLMLDSADHVTPKTGLTITSQVSIDGGAFGATANSASEIGSGIYKISLANTDTNGTTLMFKFSSAGADTRYMEVITQA